MQSMRSGFRRAAGAESAPANEKSSKLGNIVWTLILIGAVGVLLYRWYG